MKARSRHNPQGLQWSPTLDILRAIAITLVIFRHGISVPSLSAPDLPGQPVYNLMANGWLGVDLFFVLSGYLLSTQVLRLLDQRRYSATIFLARRALRTFPAYLVVLVVLWLGALAPFLDTSGVRDPTVLFTHLLFLIDYFGPPVLVTFWSLATEEKFYLAMSLLVPALNQRSKPAAYVLLVALVAAIIFTRSFTFGTAPSQDYASFFWEFRAPFHFAADGLLMGVFAGFAWHHGYRPDKASYYLLLLLLGTAILFFTLVEWAPEHSPGRALIAIPVFSALIALVVLMHPQLDKLVGTNWTARAAGAVARISYSLYLTHYIAAQLANLWLHPATATGLGQCIYWAVYLGMSFALGCALFRLVELPGLELRERFFSSPEQKVQRTADGRPHENLQPSRRAI